jgi:hypothetical protein
MFGISIGYNNDKKLAIYDDIKFKHYNDILNKLPTADKNKKVSSGSYDMHLAETSIYELNFKTVI